MVTSVVLKEHIVGELYTMCLWSLDFRGEGRTRGGRKDGGRESGPEWPHDIRLLAHYIVEQCGNRPQRSYQKCAWVHNRVKEHNELNAKVQVQPNRSLKRIDRYKWRLGNKHKGKQGEGRVFFSFC